jgi:hypothetical protein
MDATIAARTITATTTAEILAEVRCILKNHLT